MTLTTYRRRVLIAEQLAFTRAIVLCEGVASRRDRTLTRGALECAAMLTHIRDKVSRDSGLLREMGRKP